MHFSKDIFQVTIFQVATSQRVGSEAQQAALEGGGRALCSEKTWKVPAWEFSQLRSCHLGKYPWEVAAWGKALGKVPNIVITTGRTG